MGAKRCVALVAGGFLLYGCGYRFIGSRAPFGANRIAVRPFVETVPVGIAEGMADTLARHLASDGVTLAFDSEGADAILDGRVLSATTVGSPFGGGGGISGYRVDIRVKAHLRTRKGKKLWEKEVNIFEDFVPTVASGTNGPLVTEANRRRALRRAANTAAQRLHQELILAAAMESTHASKK